MAPTITQTQRWPDLGTAPVQGLVVAPVGLLTRAASLPNSPFWDASLSTHR